MNETAVSNTGPPLHLSEIGQEHQLTLFRQVNISEQVRVELAQRRVFGRIVAALGTCLVVENVTQPELDSQRVILSDFKIHQADLTD